MAKMTATQRREVVRMLCQMCGNRFQTKLPTRAKYCSLACRVRAFRTNTRYGKWLAHEEAKAALFNEELKKEVKAHAEIADFDQLLGPILDRMPSKEQRDLLLFLRQLKPPMIDHQLKKRGLLNSSDIEISEGLK